MTRIEIVTQLLAAQVARSGIFVSDHIIEEAGTLADKILYKQEKWYEINKPKQTGGMG